MKPKFIFVIISAVLLGMISCKKLNNNYAPNGKWQETKVRTYVLDSGKITYDTTYLQPFTKLDYIQFTGNLCSISIDHYYYDNEPGEPKTPQLISQSIQQFNYKAIGGGKFVLNTTTINLNPGGFESTDTVSEIGTNSIILHNVFWGHGAQIYGITDSYYEK